MDDYIEFCGRTLIGSHVRREGILDGYFPMGLEGALCDDGEEAEMTRGMANEAWNDEYRTVLERGSRVVGVSVEYLNRLVRRLT